MSTTCYIYRCSARPDMYIYLATKDDFESLPEGLRKNLGVTEFAMELELNPDKKLARENPAEVLDNLKKQGFHLQMPANISVDEIMEKIARENQAKQGN